jgi:hypothetical protein
VEVEQMIEEGDIVVWNGRVLEREPSPATQRRLVGRNTIDDEIEAELLRAMLS